jgi:sigma54-dependent transcription regulator
MSQLFPELDSLLGEQLQLFNSMMEKQTFVLEELKKSEKDFQLIMTTLKTKEDLVIKVGENLEKSRPQIAMWLQEKDTLSKKPEYAGIETKLNQIEEVANQLKVLDEELIKIMNPPSDDDPMNRINAYRALQ